MMGINIKLSGLIIFHSPIVYTEQTRVGGAHQYISGVQAIMEIEQYTNVRYAAAQGYPHPNDIPTPRRSTHPCLQHTIFLML